MIIGAAYDQKVDLWSLGCVLAELYSGEVLLHNDSLASLLGTFILTLVWAIRMTSCVLFTARCVGIFGPFDPRLLRRGRYAANYFTKSGLVYERDETSEELRLMRPKKTTLARRLGLDPEVSLFLVIIRVIRLTSCFVYRWTRRSAGATGSSGFYWGCWR